MSNNSKNVKPILVINNLNLASWRRKTEDIFLNAKGNIYCNSFIIKDYTRDKRYRRMYSFAKEYLDSKKRKYDISQFYSITIGDLRWIMIHKKMKSISYKRIEEIVHWENQIGEIRESIVKRVKNYILDKKYKEDMEEFEKLKNGIKSSRGT